MHDKMCFSDTLNFVRSPADNLQYDCKGQLTYLQTTETLMAPLLYEIFFFISFKPKMHIKTYKTNIKRRSVTGHALGNISKADSCQ